MRLIRNLRNSTLLRAPLLAATRFVLRPLKTGPALLRRAFYDAVPLPYIVTGQHEQYVVSTTDKVIGRELFLHGEFDFCKLQTALAILTKEGLKCPSHLIDVGANIGTVTIPALARGLVQSATAIEPHPDNLRLLRTNLALNNVADHVRVFAQAVGAEPDAMLNLTESPTNSGNHAIGTNGIPVYSSRLDDMDWPSLDCLLWMDIEGYEGHALRGASILLATGVPVVCEYNPSFLRAANGLHMFRQALAGRRVFDLQDMTLTETTLEAIQTRLTCSADYTDVLCIPTGNT